MLRHCSEIHLRYFSFYYLQCFCTEPFINGKLHIENPLLYEKMYLSKRKKRYMDAQNSQNLFDKILDT